MGQTWTEDAPPPPPRGERSAEHPVIALIAVIAIIAAIVLIAWARLELRGTGELEAALREPSAAQAPVPAPETELTEEEREVDEAVTSSRFATGFSP